MKFKKIVFVLILVVFLFTIAGASAGDANNTLLDSGDSQLIDDADNEILQSDANENLDVETHESDVPLKEDNSLDNTRISSSQKTDDSSDDESSDVTTVIFRAAIPKIIAEKKTCELTNKPVKYRVTLKDTFDGSIANEKVTLKIDGKVYSAITNAKGIATFKIINLNKKGKFKASITFNGNEYYKKSTVKGKIVVKDVFSVISKNSKDKSAVKKVQQALKDNGYYITYKGHYLMVDGWYGPCTFKSVKQFQKAKKLKVTGKVDAKTASKLNLIKDKSDNVVIEFVNNKIKTPNAVIKFENDKAFKCEYHTGHCFEAQIIDKSTGKGIQTLLENDYYQNGKKLKKIKFTWYNVAYMTGEDGCCSIEPGNVNVGTYNLKVYCEEPTIKAIPKYKKIIITKTSIKIKVKEAKLSGNKKLKLNLALRFKNKADVNEGKVKITAGGNSYIVNVHDGVINKNIKLKNTKSKKVTIKYLGNKNIKPKTVTVKMV